MKFSFNEDYILENNIVNKLSPLSLENQENLMKFSLKEPEIWEYSLMKASGKENLNNYINSAIQKRTDRNSYSFIVYDKRKNKYCGSTRFYDIDLENKCLTVGYTWYGKEFRGTDLNKNCKYLLLKFAFEEMEMERVEFRADNDNAISINAMKSIGCKVEGVLRSNMYKPDGTRRDSIVLSILKDEWYSATKGILKTKIS